MPLGIEKVVLLGAAGSGADPLGYVLLWGDADNSAGVNLETYPHDLELLNDGTTARIGGRMGGGSNANTRITHSNIDMSGGPGVPPAGVTDTYSWSFNPAVATQDGIYSENVGALTIDSSDNYYSVGNAYGTGSANYWYNVGVVKMNSAGAVQWDVSIRDTHYAAYGFARANIWLGDGTWPMICGIYYESVATGVKVRHQLVALNSGTGGFLTNGYRRVYCTTDTSNAANTMYTDPRRSNINGSKVATLHKSYDTSFTQLSTPILWSLTSSSFTPDWTVSDVALQNTSSGTSWGHCEGTGICLDTSNNVYVSFIFDATNYDGSGVKENHGIAKYNSSGTLQWVYCIRQQNGGDEESMYGQGITIDGSNNIYVSGYSNNAGSGSYSAPYIAKISGADGTPSLEWITQIENPSGHAYSSTIKLIGSDTVACQGYAAADNGGGGTAVVGITCVLNVDGTTLGESEVGGTGTWIARDISSLVHFHATGSYNVAVGNVTGTPIDAASYTNNVTTGYEHTWVTDTPVAPDITTGGVE